MYKEPRIVQISQDTRPKMERVYRATEWHWINRNIVKDMCWVPDERTVLGETLLVLKSDKRPYGWHKNEAVEGDVQYGFQRHRKGRIMNAVLDREVVIVYGFWDIHVNWKGLSNLSAVLWCQFCIDIDAFIYYISALALEVLSTNCRCFCRCTINACIMENVTQTCNFYIH